MYFEKMRGVGYGENMVAWERSDIVDYLLRPVALRPRHDRRDEQQDLPFGWCERCGMEVWKRGEAVCEACGEKDK